MRSITAVLVFMATCAMTATYRYYFPFWNVDHVFTANFEEIYKRYAVIFVNILLFLFFVIYLLGLVFDSDSELPLIETPVSILVGIVFAVGL